MVSLAVFFRLSETYVIVRATDDDTEQDPEALQPLSCLVLWI